MASLTTNKNYLSPTGFKLTINHQLYPNLEYFCTAVTLPDVTLPEVVTGYRQNQNMVTGDRIVYGDLPITFVITENMENYKEAFDWMVLQTTTDEVNTSDATLSILSSKLNVTNNIRFHNCFPTSMSAAEFTTNGESEFLTADLVLKYTTFEFVA